MCGINRYASKGASLHLLSIAHGVFLLRERRLNIRQVAVWVALDMADQHYLDDHLCADGLTTEQG